MKGLLKERIKGCFESIRKVFIVMYWKNLTLKLRHYIQTILEILVPTLLFAATLAIYLEGGEGISPEAKNGTIYGDVPFFLQYCA